VDTFFKHTDLNRNEAEQIVSETLNKCDDGELYLENSKSEILVLDDNKIKTTSYNTSLGYGLRAVTGDVTAYSHSNEISKHSLKESSNNLFSTLKSKKGTYNRSISRTNVKLYSDINPIEAKPLKAKIDILKKVDGYLRKKENVVKQVTASFLGRHEEIEILRCGGETFKDIRPLIRFDVSVMVEKNGRKEMGTFGTGGRMSYDDYLKDENWKQICNEALRQAQINLDSKPAPAGEMKVVLGPGLPGILLHEAIGHGLEGDFNRKKTSAFHNLMGQRVASEGVTIIDGEGIMFTVKVEVSTSSGEKLNMELLETGFRNHHDNHAGRFMQVLKYINSIKVSNVIKFSILISIIKVINNIIERKVGILRYFITLFIISSPSK